MKAVFDQNYVKNLHGTHIKKGKNKFDLAQQLRSRHPRFQEEKQMRPARRGLVVLHGSFLKPEAVHKDDRIFRKRGLKENHGSANRAVD